MTHVVQETVDVMGEPWSEPWPRYLCPKHAAAYDKIIIAADGGKTSPLR